MVAGGQSGDLNHIREIWRGELMNSLKCLQKYFKIGAIFDWEPMTLLQDGGGDVVIIRAAEFWTR